MPDMRVWAEKAYGIPPEQVVGSSGMVKLQTGAGGKPELMKLAKVEFIDDVFKHGQWCSCIRTPPSLASRRERNKREPIHGRPDEHLMAAKPIDCMR